MKSHQAQIQFIIIIIINSWSKSKVENQLVRICEELFRETVLSRPGQQHLGLMHAHLRTNLCVATIAKGTNMANTRIWLGYGMLSHAWQFDPKNSYYLCYHVDSVDSVGKKFIMEFVSMNIYVHETSLKSCLRYAELRPVHVLLLDFCTS